MDMPRAAATRVWPSPMLRAPALIDALVPRPRPLPTILLKFTAVHSRGAAKSLRFLFKHREQDESPVPERLQGGSSGACTSRSIQPTRAANLITIHRVWDLGITT